VADIGEEEPLAALDHELGRDDRPAEAQELEEGAPVDRAGATGRGARLQEKGDRAGGGELLGDDRPGPRPGERRSHADHGTERAAGQEPAGHAREVEGAAAERQERRAHRLEQEERGHRRDERAECRFLEQEREERRARHDGKGQERARGERGGPAGPPMRLAELGPLHEGVVDQRAHHHERDLDETERQGTEAELGSPQKPGDRQDRAHRDGEREAAFEPGPEDRARDRGA
jgi:hypothetical protein